MTAISLSSFSPPSHGKKALLEQKICFKRIIYTYDLLDRVTSMTSPAGTTKYHYDTTTGRLDKITSPEGKEFTYSYDHGQLKEMQFPNGITAHYAFDDNGNLTNLHYQRNDGSTVQRFQYSYDKNNMRTSMTDLDGTHNYAYDSLYQVIQATHPTAPNPLEQFSYDAAGNRLSDDVKSAYQYNELNQLTEDDSCTYAYDADGNMTAKIDKQTGDSMVYTWNIENRLMQVRKPEMLAEYTYDALGRRMNKEVNGVVTQYRYDGEDLILEMNENDSVTASYTFGPGIDNALMMNRQGANYYYVKDRLGSVIAVTDSTANTIKSYQYSTFGKIVRETGLGILNSFTYTSREYDPETGNYYYRARYFNPNIGRFLSCDPLQFASDDNNFYRYVSNSPFTYIDPLGLSACMAGCMTGVAARILASELTWGASDLLLGDAGAGTMADFGEGISETEYKLIGGASAIEKYKEAIYKQLTELDSYKPSLVFSGKPSNLFKWARVARVVKGVSFIFDAIDFIKGIDSCSKKCETIECNK